MKAGFLSAVATGETSCPLIDRQHAIRLLGEHAWCYNISTLIGLLDDAELGVAAADELKHTLLVFDAFYDVVERANNGSTNAQAVLKSWADGEWFTRQTEVPESLKMGGFQSHRRDQYGRSVTCPRRLVST